MDSTPIPDAASGAASTAAITKPATSPLAAYRAATPRQRNVMLLALTFIVVVIIAILSPDITAALMWIAVVLGFYVTCRETAPSAAVQQPSAAVKEGYTALPGAPAPYLVGIPPLPPPAGSEGHYPGAIDVDEYETEAEYGHRDRTEGDNAGMPYGNPFNRTRVGVPMGADACVDDEANFAEMDADELNTYQVAARNDPERVAAGTINRRRDMKKYFEEEVQIAEDREWWGRHEL